METAFKKLVVLDPGHGGKYPGACSGGIEESDINLDIALVCQRKLLRAGFDVAVTRTTDVYPPNASRATFSNRHGGDVYISLHCNAASNPSARGWEIVFGNGCRNGKQLAENLGVTMADLPIPARINPIKDESAVGRGNNFRLAVLHSTIAPACLIEMGFISNPFDRAFLTSADGMDRISDAVIKGLVRYFS